MKRDSQPTERWKSGMGIAGQVARTEPREGESPVEAAVTRLRPLGCGAWHGRTACGNPANWFAQGWLGLYFMAHRTIHAGPSALYGGPSPVFATFCDRHAGDINAVIRDMPDELVTDQEFEMKKVLNASHLDSDRPDPWLVVVSKLAS